LLELLPLELLPLLLLELKLELESWPLMLHLIVFDHYAYEKFL